MATISSCSSRINPTPKSTKSTTTWPNSNWTKQVSFEMFEINKNPSRQELRYFGLIFALFFGLIGGLIWWKFSAPKVAYWLWGIGGGVAVVYYLVPPLKKTIFLGWMYFAYPIGWVMSHLLLSIIYYVILTPIGLLMRLFGYDPMQRKWDAGASTYWIEKETDESPRRYFRQF